MSPYTGRFVVHPPGARGSSARGVSRQLEANAGVALLTAPNSSCRADAGASAARRPTGSQAVEFSHERTSSGPGCPDTRLCGSPPLGPGMQGWPVDELLDAAVERPA